MKKTYHITGMHCPSCDVIVKRKLLKVQGVQDVVVDRAKEIVDVYCDSHIRLTDLNTVFEGTEYALFDERQKKSYVKKIFEITFFVIVLLPVMILLSRAEFFTNGVTVQDNMGLWFIFVLGLVASFSSCIAVAGGLLLGISTRYAEQHRKKKK